MKVWIVEVSLTINVPVVAETKKEAEEIALEHSKEEMENSGIQPDVSVGYCQEITTKNLGDLEFCLPYGVDDEDPRRNWTIEQWLNGGKRA